MYRDPEPLTPKELIYVVIFTFVTGFLAYVFGAIGLPLPAILFGFAAYFSIVVLICSLFKR